MSIVAPFFVSPKCQCCEYKLHFENLKYEWKRLAYQTHALYVHFYCENNIIFSFIERDSIVLDVENPYKKVIREFSREYRRRQVRQVAKEAMQFDCLMLVSHII